MNRTDEITLWLNHNPRQDNKKAKKYSDAILHRLLKNACPESAPFKINRTENGKPYTDAPIYFSYSHSRQTYLYGLSKHGEMGLDIERTDKKRDFMTLSKRYFHADEYKKIKALPSPDRAALFYRLWSRKEAWCKLCGGVLWYYLGRSVLDNQPLNEGNETLHLTDLTNIQGYVGALATAYPIHQIFINTIK